MNNSYIPAVFKEKLIEIYGWFKGSIYLLLSVSIFLSIFTFNINDDSFLTKSGEVNSNILGIMGSYIASFLIYSFGLMSFLISLFLLINSTMFTTLLIIELKKYLFFTKLLNLLNLFSFNPINSAGNIPTSDKTEYLPPIKLL